MTLLEVLLSTVILGIALTGFLMAIATSTTSSKSAKEETQLTYLANLEFESLRAAKFGEIPFLATSTPGHLEEVPDYINDIAISQKFPGGNCLIVASGDLTPTVLSTVTTEYSRDFAFDGKRATSNTRWMGANNALAYQAGGGPNAGGPGGGGGPGAGGPGGGPGAGGNFAPSNYQYIYCAFPTLTRISRILYDSRFNVTELTDAATDDFDYLPHDKDIWQKDYDFFWTDKVLGYGEIYDPWSTPPEPLALYNDLVYGSSGIVAVFDNAKKPLEAGIIGMHNVDTYSDFDKNFHWPYASEIEVYGFAQATAFVESNNDPVSPQYNNVIMYFPNYMGSGYDMGRHVYQTASSVDAVRAGHGDLMKVDLKFFPVSKAHNDLSWQKVDWWDPRQTNELGRFSSSFYRDATTRIDRLPNLHDYPVHKVYADNEDVKFPFSVPGATSIRAHFGVFDLEPAVSTDEVYVEDAAGNQYSVEGIPSPGYGNMFFDKWTDWIPGDTIVIHFKSNGTLNSTDSGYGGFAIDSVEVGSVVMK
jgi:type II secretory pathway pseudopilin PulG